jgi:hypothetical protein
MKTMDEVEVSVNAPGRMAKQARDELALNNELTQWRAERHSDDREVADLPKHMSADQNAKLSSQFHVASPVTTGTFWLIEWSNRFVACFIAFVCLFVDCWPVFCWNLYEKNDITGSFNTKEFAYVKKVPQLPTQHELRASKQMCSGSRSSRCIPKKDGSCFYVTSRINTWSDPLYRVSTQKTQLYRVKIQHTHYE